MHLVDTNSPFHSMIPTISLTHSFIYPSRQGVTPLSFLTHLKVDGSLRADLNTPVKVLRQISYNEEQEGQYMAVSLKSFVVSGFEPHAFRRSFEDQSREG